MRVCALRKTALARVGGVGGDGGGEAIRNGRRKTIRDSGDG